MRSEVAEYGVVPNAEFLLLSEVEQDNQIIMKIRQWKLKEEKSKEYNGDIFRKTEVNSIVNDVTQETALIKVEKNKLFLKIST